jgi:hypothetical protein
MCFLGDKNTISVPSFLFFASLHTRETVDLLAQHASAVRSWHLQQSSLLRFYSDIFFKETIRTYNKYFANVATVTIGTTATTCT